MIPRKFHFQSPLKNGGITHAGCNVAMMYHAHSLRRVELQIHYVSRNAFKMTVCSAIHMRTIGFACQAYYNLLKFSRQNRWQLWPD